jgi:hypothetical protein
MKLDRRKFLHLAAGATRPAGPARPPGGGGGGSGGGSRFGVNVLDFGADPTGNHDCVAAFESAMMAAGGGAYGRVCIPLGNYALSRSINLDIINTRTPPHVLNRNEQTSVRFEGEGWTSTRGQQPMCGSTLMAPPNDYCFKSTANSSGTGNEDNLFSFQGLQFFGYGGIYIADGSQVIRDCSFITWRGIVLPVCFMTLIENIVIRNFGGNTSNDPNLGQVGIFAGGDGVIRMVDARQLNQGTCIAVGGNWVLERLHMETSKQGLLLGYAAFGNPGDASYRNYCIGTAKMITSESNLVNVYVNNFQGEMSVWNLAGFQDGPTQTLAQVYLKFTNYSTFEQITCAGACSQSAILTGAGSIPSSDGTVSPIMQNNNLTNVYQLASGNYNTGTTVLPIARNLSVRFPDWLRTGVTVSSYPGNQIPQGTTVAAVSPKASITLSKPLTAPMVAPGDAVQFASGGQPLGGFDYNYDLSAGLAPF